MNDAQTKLFQERERRHKSAWLTDMQERRVVKSEPVTFNGDKRFGIQLTRFATLSEDLTRVEQTWLSPVAELTIVDQDGHNRTTEVDVTYLLGLRYEIDQALPYLRYAVEHEGAAPTEPLLKEDEHGDTYYIGPLEPAKRLVSQERYVREEGPNEHGLYTVKLGDSEDVDNSVAEFGHDHDQESAWRYALGAYFGPMDEGYDGLRLRVLLEQHQAPSSHGDEEHLSRDRSEEELLGHLDLEHGIDPNTLEGDLTELQSIHEREHQKG